MISRKTIRFSQHPVARMMRHAYYLPGQLSIPGPRIVFSGFQIVYLSGRSVIHFLRRVFIAEPLFKSYCYSYGKRLHTGIFVHWIQGNGHIILGDDVRFDGKSSLTFAARYSDKPALLVGDRTGIGHACSFRVGKSIQIGNDCRIASNVTMFDAPGHPADPETRKQGGPASPEDIKPIVIGNNVWIGSRSIIFPGVTIGNNSIVAMGSSVMTNVPDDTIVGGNPARNMMSLVKVKNA
jgi:NDP-sugar pyrophosphorylase family protein